MKMEHYWYGQEEQVSDLSQWSKDGSEALELTTKSNTDFDSTYS